MAKAYIAATTRIVNKFLENACEKNNIETISLKDESNIIKELQEIKPDIIFLQANILEDSKENIISKIKEDDNLGSSFIVVHAARVDGADFAYEAGADAFLPVPFLDSQVLSIFRRALNQPKQLLIVNKIKSCSSPLFLALIESGFLTHSVVTGAEGIEFAKTHFPDLILCENRLIDMVGSDFCTKVHNTPITSHMPVVILSDTDKVDEIEKSFNAGVKDILLEPFSSEENIKKINEIISPPKKGRKMKALVVDDSGTIRNLVSKMFRQLGFEVANAENGLEGLKVVKEFVPDIVTSDYDMPIMTGWEFCSEMKKDEQTKDIPIIMVTSRDSAIDMKKGKFLGVSAYLPKPFKVEELSKTVKEVLDEAQQTLQRKVLSKYVAADTLKNVAQVIEGIKDKEPEERFISVLFSDICSFTAKCERLNAKKIVKLLNAYFDSMVEVLQQHNAIVDKFIGDAIVVRFDSEDPKDDALNAAKAALGMLEALNKFNEESLEEINIRIGINSGNVIMGNLGSEKHRLEYAMIGDNVNVGQRLESKAPKQGCLISESTYNLIKDDVTVGELQELTVKGRKNVVNAYTLLSIKD
jgi:CheY-like chemotaxis protein/class 3 adenylate cyclase